MRLANSWYEYGEPKAKERGLRIQGNAGLDRNLLTGGSEWLLEYLTSTKYQSCKVRKAYEFIAHWSEELKEGHALKATPNTEATWSAVATWERKYHWSVSY